MLHCNDLTIFYKKIKYHSAVHKPYPFSIFVNAHMQLQYMVIINSHIKNS